MPPGHAGIWPRRYLGTWVLQVLISAKHRFIFVHIYKTGGDSLTDALRPYADRFPGDEAIRRIVGLWTRYIGGLPPALLRERHRFPKHIDALTLYERIPEEQVAGSFKFAFVRNPWDWQVSLYHYARSNPNTHQTAEYRALDGFEDYVRWRLEKGQRTQKSFISNLDGQIIVDFVGRFETLNRDFQAVCDKIGITAALPHINASERTRYQDYYTPETRDAIGELFEDDIEAFDYEFESD